jgi:hypothetical protein
MTLVPGRYGCPLCDDPPPHSHDLGVILNAKYFCPDGGGRSTTDAGGGRQAKPAHCPHGTAMIQPGRDTTGREADGA